MLLVDADDAHLAERREDRGARPDDDLRLPERDSLALVAALCVGQAGMQQRDRIAEARLEPSERLRGQRDLGHEHDRCLAALQRRRARLQVDLGLAATGFAVEKEVAAAGVEAGLDPRQGRNLLARQLRRLRRVRERLPLTRRRLLLSPLPFHRRDQLERPPGRRAVVVRDPEREIDEHRGQLVEHGVDQNRLDTLGSLVDELDDDSPPPRATERHGDDGALRRSVRQLVGEWPRERAGRHEWVNGREAGHGPERSPGTRRRPSLGPRRTDP